jgi:hypothetical protein
MSGTLHQKTISKAFPINKALLIEMLIPFILGMLAITAHARLRLHLGIPGHHGLIFMALMVIARKTSKLKWPSFIFSAGVGSMLYLPFLGFGDPFAVLVYLWPGIIFDTLYALQNSKQNKIWFVALIGGLSYSTIPLSRSILGILTGIIHKSVMLGVLVPFFSFFLFGSIGVLIGLGTFSIGIKNHSIYKKKHNK